LIESIQVNSATRLDEMVRMRARLKAVIMHVLRRIAGGTRSSGMNSDWPQWLSSCQVHVAGVPTLSKEAVEEHTKSEHSAL
jgi:hypothetical protein